MTTDLAGRIAELAAQIEERLTEDETTAKAVFDAAKLFSNEPQRQGPLGHRVFDGSGIVVTHDRSVTLPSDVATHIARNDPARVLRRVAVTRELVAAILAEPHDHARNPAGHQRVARLLTIIATEWEDEHHVPAE